MSIIRLGYISKYKMSMNYNEYFSLLRKLSDVGIKNNSKCNITGALLFDDQYFVQFLEGAQEDVIATFAKIERDERHNQITLIEKAPVPSRVFGNWWMAGLLRSGKTVSLFEPYQRNGLFHPTGMTAGELLSLMVDLTEANPEAQLASKVGDRAQNDSLAAA